MIAALGYRLHDLGARLHSRYLTNVLFVHVNKTAGTSIERALGLPFQHRTALELRALVGPERWAECFTFAFVRNPWDRVASHYAFRVKTDQTGLGDAHLGFNEWVVRAYGARDPRYYDQPKMFMPQTDWITDDAGSMLVDYVGRFESLREDFDEVCRILGREASLPHLKGSPRRNLAGYTDRAKEVVRSRFAPDIDRFEYRFEDAGAVTGGEAVDSAAGSSGSV